MTPISLQWYVPPLVMLTKEWIRMILNKEKRFLPISSVKMIDVGNFPELAVKKIYAEFATRPELKAYLPPKINKGRQCDKQWFFNLINSFYEEELEAIVAHANRQRYGKEDGEMNAEQIEVDREVYGLMTKHPWKSVSTPTTM